MSTSAHVPVFLNERSYPLSAENQSDVAESVKVLLRTLVRAQEIAPKLVLGSQARLSDIPLDEAFTTLATVSFRVGRDWWRFLSSLEQRAPFGAVPGCYAPDGTHVVLDDEHLFEAGSWASANKTLVISFRGAPWDSPLLEAGECACKYDAHACHSSIALANAADPAHVNEHKEKLSSYGLEVAGGALVYSGERYSLRMPPRDHLPMHVHVCPRDSAEPTLATVRFDIEPEILAGKLDRLVFRDVRDVLVANLDHFRSCWDRRRSGAAAWVLREVIKGA